VPAPSSTAATAAAGCALLRDCLGRARRDQHGVLAALIGPIFNAGAREEARDRLSAAVAVGMGAVVRPLSSSS